MPAPYWRHSNALGTRQIDALVVGAGVCGLSVATELLERNLRVAIVERQTLGAGASGRNAGFLMRGMAENYAAAIQTHGRARARAMWRFTEENLAILLERGIDALPSFRRVPSCLMAIDTTELAQLRESLALLREDAFAADWLDTHDDSAWASGAALGALVNPADASINPWQMLQHLGAPLRPLIFEQQELLGIHPADARHAGPLASPGHVIARTTDGAFLARHVILCTNAYTPRVLAAHDPTLAAAIAPKRGQMLAIRPDTPYRLDFSYYINFGHEYARQTPDGTVVVGGKRTTRADEEVGYDDEPTEAIQRELEAFARGTLGLEGGVMARWGGTMGFTADGLPLVGPIATPDLPDRAVWLCAGFTGHGMSL
ncbi:MAG: FAD-binding oxidoreductase, partial [Phycisphaerales bacterium]|nr:FAD-binding oxidoreductase [Phycisphaerales bacterium]